MQKKCRLIINLPHKLFFFFLTTVEDSTPIERVEQVTGQAS